MNSVTVVPAIGSATASGLQHGPGTGAGALARRPEQVPGPNAEQDRRPVPGPNAEQGRRPEPVPAPSAEPTWEPMPARQPMPMPEPGLPRAPDSPARAAP